MLARACLRQRKKRKRVLTGKRGRASGRRSFSPRLLPGAPWWRGNGPSCLLHYWRRFPSDPDRLPCRTAKKEEKRKKAARSKKCERQSCCRKNRRGTGVTARWIGASRRGRNRRQRGLRCRAAWRRNKQRSRVPSSERVAEHRVSVGSTHDGCLSDLLAPLRSVAVSDLMCLALLLRPRLNLRICSLHLCR